MKVFRPQQVVATADHNVPTMNQHLPIKDELSRKQVEQLIENCEKHDIELYGLGHPFQGIVHVIGPELGITQPGMTIVCGDSHTIHTALLVQWLLALVPVKWKWFLLLNVCLQSKPKLMRINIEGELNKGVVSKDIILYIISKISASGATGYFVEYAGSAIRELSMEARMTICNMSIEMGARGGMIAPDETTFEYMKGRRLHQRGEQWDKKAGRTGKNCIPMKMPVFDKEININAADIEPMITYGTNPGMGISVNGNIPSEDQIAEKGESHILSSRFNIWGFNLDASIKGKKVDYVFIGSCTNSRIEDLRMVASFVKGKKKADNVEVWVVPGSKQVEKQAKEEGIDKIFEAGRFYTPATRLLCMPGHE